MHAAVLQTVIHCGFAAVFLCCDALFGNGYRCGPIHLRDGGQMHPQIQAALLQVVMHCGLAASHLALLALVVVLVFDLSKNVDAQSGPSLELIFAGAVDECTSWEAKSRSGK